MLHTFPLPLSTEEDVRLSESAMIIRRALDELDIRNLKRHCWKHHFNVPPPLGPATHPRARQVSLALRAARSDYAPATRSLGHQRSGCGVS